MTDTQKRIRSYQSALPGLRERVAAVALLLVMSIIMMTSASFAWLTISHSPEVSGVSTNVAANGNLEIALASGNQATVTAPGDSKVGDSSAAEGQSVTAANLTWGNLVNLTDASYGLDNLTLRPAQLNTTALLTSPLYGATYSKDGRVETLTSNFAYTAWVPASGNTPGYFGLSNDLGVRAISSTKVDAVGFLGDYLALKNASDIANVKAGNAFIDITRNSTWMNSLAAMMGMHMTATLNYEDEYVNASADPEDLKNLIEMYDAFIAAYELEAQAMANILNTQLFLAYGGDTSKYTAYTGETILTTLVPNANQNRDYERSVTLTDDQGNSTTKTVKLINLKTFLDDYKMLVADVATLREISTGGDYRWTASGLKTVINKLVKIDTCIVDGKTVKDLMAQFNADITSALGYRGKEVECIITNGVLYNFSQRTGATVRVEPTNSDGKKGLPIEATVYVAKLSMEQSATIYAKISTSATPPSEFAQELAYADGLNTGADSSTMEVIAQDTYGLAVDLWVRTNSSGSYLTLEGNVLTEKETVNATGKDANGNTVDLYTLNRTEEVTETDENGDPVTQNLTINYELYKTETENGDGTTTVTWYNAATYNEFTLQDGESPMAKIVEVEHVIGYEGENRIWQDNSLLSTDSTTQGSGSCYVYYADTPEDQARSLELLQAMNVAFVDASGALLATAEMDTERFYADSGRVTVPLVLSSDSINLGEDLDGNVISAITALEQNVPTRITAIVYLDGTLLSNDNVLAAADIQGQLNIQFGSSFTLDPIKNEKLETAERRASASVSVASFDYDTHVGDMTTTVTVNVDGEQPSTVTAFFMRQINSTQGSREAVMTFTQNESGAWVADYTFTTPGNYVLRTVQLDGTDYVFDSENAPTVTVTGFALASLSCTQADANRHISIMTAESSSTVDLSLKFATNDDSKLPTTVQGRFLREDGTAVNVNFTYNPTNQYWNGSATFLSSGDYVFQYLVLDGKYKELDANLQQTASVYLGMKAAVYTTSPTSFKYLPSEMTDNQKLLGMQVKIMDDTGKEMSGLTGTKLTYHLEGSAINTMDTDLTWDPVKGYYTGELKALESGGPGNWLFSKVTVGSNNITNDTTSPVFSIISPEPPSYDGFQPLAYQFAPNGDAKMNIDIKYSATAKVMAVITDAKGTEYNVAGVISSTDGTTNVTTWNFAIPKVSGTQDGHWTMQKVYVWNYFDAAGDFITVEVDENGCVKDAADLEKIMCIDMADKGYTTKVVQTINVKFTEGQSKNYGITGKTVVGNFMDSYTISGLTVKIEDFEGPVKDINDVQIVYAYGGDSVAKGGYSGSAIPEKGMTAFTIVMSPDNAGTTFTQTGTQTIQFAGTYTPTFSFKVGSTTMYINSVGINAVGTVPAFTVSSVVPTVKITEAYYLSAKSKTASSFTDTATTVYFYEYETTSTVCGQTFRYKAYNQPNVTITLADCGNAAGATLTFAESNGGDVRLYLKEEGTDSNKTNSFTWTGNGVCKRWVGYWDSQTGDDEKTAAGTLTANSLVLSYNGNDYSIADSKVTISNPS